MAAKKSKNAEVKYYGTGRRKSSVARVYLQAGEGKITVNGRDADEFFPHDTLVIDVKQPLSLTGNIDKFDVIAFVNGGGYTGQAGALRLGITRALLQVSPDYRKTLKVAGLVTVDARVKERKKYGLKGARQRLHSSPNVKLWLQKLWIFQSSFFVIISLKKYILFICMKNFFKISLSISLPLLFFLIITLIRPFIVNKTIETNNSLFGLTVFIDPGHGGLDPGTSNDVVLEKDINLKLSKKLYEKMLSNNVGAYISRTSDYDLSSINSKNHKLEDLKNRVKQVNESQANLLVSIHLNALNNQSVHGPMVYYRKNDPASQLFAQTMQNKLNEFSGLEKKCYQENYYIFRNTNIPAILIECGFLSNPDEKSKLLTNKYQEEITNVIFNGIKEFWLNV